MEIKMNQYNRKNLRHIEERKYRYELKYVCSEGELIQIKKRIETFCKLDPHVDEKGRYRIRSIYFDDEYNNCFYENENGTDPREKFRIRVYNEDFSLIFLECKGKESNRTFKDYSIITAEDCKNILEEKITGKYEDDKLLSKFYIQYKGKRLRSKVIVMYERAPYIYPVGNVRITLDKNIGGTEKVHNFFDKYLPVRPVMPIGQHILEVKYDELLPDFLYQIMNLGNLRQTAYSKYYFCRKFTIGNC